MNKKQIFINEIFKLVAILENSWDFIFSQVWLTVKTYWILYLISTWTNTSRDLLTWTYWSKPNMAKKLKFLEENWFINRNIDTDDKRIFRFTMTKKAIKTLEKISPIYEKNILKIFENIDDETLKKSLWVVDQMINNLKVCITNKTT